VNIKILACQIIGPAAAGSAGSVPTALPAVSVQTSTGRHPLAALPHYFYTQVDPKMQRNRLGAECAG